MLWSRASDSGKGARINLHGDVVGKQIARASIRESEQDGRDNAALFDHALGHHSVVAYPPFHCNEHQDQDPEQGEQGDDAAVGPGVSGTSPLEGNEKACDARGQDQQAIQIQGVEESRERQRWRRRDLWRMDEEEKAKVAETANGQIHVKGPSPCNLLRKSAADHGPDAHSEAQDAADDSSDKGPAQWWSKDGDQGERADQEASRPNAGDGTADDEGRRVGGRAADGRTDEEEEHAAAVDDADGIPDVELAELQLGDAEGHVVDAAVPTKVFERLEFIGDSWRGRRDNTAILHEKVSPLTKTPQAWSIWPSHNTRWGDLVT